MIIPGVNFGEKNVYHSVSFVTQARDHNANRELDEDRQTGRRKKKLQRRGNVFTTQPLMARAPVEIHDGVDKLL